MGGCAVPFCNNSAAKGYIMKIIPKNPVRRAIWIQNIPYKNWEPTKNAVLCEVSNNVLFYNSVKYSVKYNKYNFNQR